MKEEDLKVGDLVIVLRDRAQEYDYSTTYPPSGSNEHTILRDADKDKVWYLNEYEGDRDILCNRFSSRDLELIKKTDPSSGDVLVKVPGQSGPEFMKVDDDKIEACYKAFDSDFLCYCTNIATALALYGAKQISVVFSEKSVDRSADNTSHERTAEVSARRKDPVNDISGSMSASLKGEEKKREECKKEIVGRFEHNDPNSEKATEHDIKKFLSEKKLDSDTALKSLWDILDRQKSDSLFVRIFNWLRWFFCGKRHVSDVKRVATVEVERQIEYHGWEKCDKGLKAACQIKIALKGKTAGMQLDGKTALGYKKSEDSQRYREVSKHITLKISM